MVLTGKERRGSLSRVVQPVEGAASGAPAGAVPLGRERGALRFPEAVFVRRRRAVWVSGAEGGDAQALAETVLHPQTHRHTHLIHYTHSSYHKCHEKNTHYYFNFTLTLWLQCVIPITDH